MPLVAGLVGGRLEHGRPARELPVGAQVLQAERERIQARQLGEHVDELLRGERGLRPRRRAQRARLEDAERLRDRLADHLVARSGRLDRDVVERRQVLGVRRPGPERRRLEPERELAGGEQRRARLRGLRRLVGDDVAVAVDAALQVGQERLAVARPALLVPAHQLQPHRRLRLAREQRRRLGDVERVPAVAERARALVEDDAHVRERQAERRREILRALLDVLRVRVDGDAVRAAAGRGRVLGDGAAGADRVVAAIGCVERRGQRLRGARERGVEVADVARDARRDLACGVGPAELARHGWTSPAGSASRPTSPSAAAPPGSRCTPSARRPR